LIGVLDDMGVMDVASLLFLAMSGLPTTDGSVKVARI
jgi:hypothetical protein